MPTSQDRNQSEDNDWNEEQREDEDEDSDALLLAPLHPDLLLWLRKKMQGTALASDIGDDTERYLREEVQSYYDLSGRPDQLPESDQDDVLRLVRRHLRRRQELLKAYAERVAQNLVNDETGVPAAAAVELRIDKEALRRALLAAQREPAEPGIQRRQNAVNSSAGSGNEGAIATGAVEQAEPDEDLLSPQERTCASAIAATFTALIAHDPDVRAFRSNVLGGNRLSKEQADAFLRSPAVRFLSSQDFEALSIPVAGHQARQIRFERGIVRARDIERRLDEPEVISYLRPNQLRDRSNQSGQSSQTGQSNQHADADQNADQDTHQDTHQVGQHRSPAFYRSYRVTLQVGPHEVQRELLTYKGGLLWIPFTPQDGYVAPLGEGTVANGDDAGDMADLSVMRMFPGSIAAILGTLADRLASSYPFARWQIARFVLTGEAPRLYPVRVTTRPTCSMQEARMMSGIPGGRGQRVIIAAKTQELDESAEPEELEALKELKELAELEELHRDVFYQRLRASANTSGETPLRGFIRVEAEPWVTADTIQRYYLHYQRKMQIDNANQTDQAERKGKSSGESALRRAHRLPSDDIALVMRWAADRYAADADGVSDVSGSVQGEPNASEPRRLTWQKMHEVRLARVKGKGEQKQRLDRGDYSSFVKTIKRAAQELDVPLPPNLHHLVRRLHRL